MKWLNEKGACMTKHKLKIWLMMKRGLLQRCPMCGIGKIFQQYLKQVSHCSHCHENIGRIQADDGPAWVVMLVVGLIMMPLVLLFDALMTWSMWGNVGIWCILSLFLTLALLPPIKGAFIAVLMHQSEPPTPIDIKVDIK